MTDFTDIYFYRYYIHLVKISTFKHIPGTLYTELEALITSWSTCKQTNKGLNKKHILYIIGTTKCRQVGE